MRRIVALIVAAPVASILLVALVTALHVLQIPKLQINVSPRLLMVGSDPAVQFYEDTKLRFGNDELTMIVVKADDVFSAPTIQAISRLSDQVRDIPEVVRVDSLATVNNVRADGDSVSSGPLLNVDEIDDPGELERVRADALRNPVFVGKLVSADARTTAVMVYTESDPEDLEFSKRFTLQIDELVAVEVERSGLDLYQVGRPYRQAIQAQTLRGDQTTILPLGVVVIVLILALVFRSLVAVLVPLAARFTTIAWAIGLMAWFGYPISMLSGIVPLLLLAVGITEDVHIVSEYRQRIAEGFDKREAISSTMDHLATPLLVTSFTTGVGFASLSLSRITILHQLGVIAALGFAASFLVTLLLVPSMLRLLPAPKLEPVAENEHSKFAMFVLGISVGAVRHRRILFAVSAALVCLSVVAIPRISVNNDIMGFFREGSEIRVRVQDVHERLSGVPIFYVVVDSGEKGGILEPRALASVAALQTFLDETGKIDQTVSVTDFLEVTNRAMHGDSDEFLQLPESKELAAQYLVIIHPADVERYIDYDQSAANILVRHNITSTREMAQLIDEIDAFAAENMPFLQVTPTAETILTTRAADELSTSMLAGMGMTVGIVAIVCALFFMSMRAALLSLIPNLLPIAIVFGLVGWLGIPLNVGTAMIAAIAIGIAVDDTVHYMARNSLELDRQHDPNKAMIETVLSEGGVIVMTSVALAIGFAVFSLSAFVPLVYFGILSAVTLLIALVADLTLTPALMSSTSFVTLWNVVGTKIGGDICEISPLFRGLTRWEARKVVHIGRIRESQPGDYVIRQGDEDDGLMFMVIRGTLRVCPKNASTDEVIAMLGAGEVFGEMSLIDRQERSADVIADTQAEVLALSSTDLDRLERRFPRTAIKISRNLTKILAERLRKTTSTLVSATRRAV